MYLISSNSRSLMSRCCNIIKATLETPLLAATLLDSVGTFPLLSFEAEVSVILGRFSSPFSLHRRCSCHSPFPQRRPLTTRTRGWCTRQACPAPLCPRRAGWRVLLLSVSPFQPARWTATPASPSPPPPRGRRWSAGPPSQRP